MIKSDVLQGERGGTPFPHYFRWGNAVPHDKNQTSGERCSSRVMSFLSFLNSPKHYNTIQWTLWKPTDVFRDLQPLLRCCSCIPVSSAECERGFSQMNLVCTSVRNRLLIERISNLLFVKLHVPPMDAWDASGEASFKEEVMLIKTSSAKREAF